MTNLQALKLSLKTNLSDELLISYFAFVSISPNDEYEPINERAVDYIAYKIIGGGINGGIDRISEGGYTIDFNSENWKSYFNWLANKWGWLPIDAFGNIVNQTFKW